MKDMETRKLIEEALQNTGADDSAESENSFEEEDEEGNRIVFDILFTFDNDKTGKHYMVFTDNSRDEQGNIQVYAAVYFPELGFHTRFPLTTEEEWAAVQGILDELQEIIRERVFGPASQDA